jgi:hypothetical protein
VISVPPFGWFRHSDTSVNGHTLYGTRCSRSHGVQICFYELACRVLNLAIRHLVLNGIDQLHVPEFQEALGGGNDVPVHSPSVRLGLLIRVREHAQLLGSALRAEGRNSLDNVVPVRAVTAGASEDHYTEALSVDQS